MNPTTRFGGRYRLHQRLSRGAASSAYAALDELTRAPVRLRVLERGLEDPARVAHFRASALASARLKHPNLVQVLDEGQEGSLPYIVTEWHEGIPLARWRGLALPWGFLRSVLLQTCDALAFIHAHGLLHLELCPDNIWVSPGPDGPIARLADVGCARLDDGWQDRGQGAKATLKLLGSLRYLAPEVADAPPWRMGVLADLYGLGLTLWELLAGTIPFSEQTGVALLLKRASLPAPELPSALGGEFHEALADLLKRLLAREPEARPRDATQVRRMLAALPAPPCYVNPLPDSEPPEPPIPTEGLPALGRAALIGGPFPLSSLAAGRVVGHEAGELSLLNAVREAVNGQGSRLALLDGPNGAGKSHLVQRVAEEVARLGLARVIPVHFDGPGRPLSGLYAALEDLLKAATTDRAGVRARVAALPQLLGIETEGLSAVLPALLRPDETPFARPGGEVDPGMDEAPTSAGKVLAGVFAEIVRRVAANEAVVVVLDDLDDAAEAEGPALVEHLLADLNLPLCLLATLRRGSAAELHVRFPAGEACLHLSVDPLGDEARRRYLEERLGLEPETAAAVSASLEPHPELLRGVADHLLDGRIAGPMGQRVLVHGVLLPEAKAELFESRLRALPSTGPDALVPDVVAGLAFAKVPLSPRTLAALAADDPHRPLHRALAAAERVGLLTRTAAGRFRFTDAKLPAFLTQRHQDRGPSWHRRWLKALERLEGGARGRLGLERAEHAEALGETSRAVEACLEAAALGLAPGQLVVERALRAACRAANLAETLSDRLRTARAKRLQAELLRQAGEHDAARAVLTDARRWLEGEPPGTEEAWCVLLSAWLEVDQGQVHAAQASFELARRLFELAGDQGGPPWTTLGQARIASLLGEHQIARTLGREAEDAFSALSATRGTLAARYLRAVAADEASDPRTADPRYAELAKLADERGWLLEAAWLRVRRVRCLLALARPHDALATLSEVRPVAQVLGLTGISDWVAAVTPATLAAAGESGRAREALGQARLPSPRLCPSAADALLAALRIPTVALDPPLEQALLRWASQIRSHGRPTLFDF